MFTSHCVELTLFLFFSKYVDIILLSVWSLKHANSESVYASESDFGWSRKVFWDHTHAVDDLGRASNTISEDLSRPSKIWFWCINWFGFIAIFTYSFSMFTSDFAAAAVLITFGAVLGKLSPIQYVVLSFFEIIVFQVNEYIGLSKFKVNFNMLISVADPGFPRRGAPTLTLRQKTYYLVRFSPKTAEKWKNWTENRVRHWLFKRLSYGSKFVACCFCFI